jgi:hypothetical protein
MSCGGAARADILSQGLDDATIARAEATDRYERRALACRQRAIRQFCALDRPGCALAHGIGVDTCARTSARQTQSFSRGAVIISSGC